MYLMLSQQIFVVEGMMMFFLLIAAVFVRQGIKIR
jgi:hypothetical protein